jgi:transcription elongation GreA/GreB family factor
MSPSSPLGSALLGAKAGDVVTYEAPNAKLKVTVLSAKAQK